MWLSCGLNKLCRCYIRYDNINCFVFLYNRRFLAKLNCYFRCYVYVLCQNVKILMSIFYMHFDVFAKNMLFCWRV